MNDMPPPHLPPPHLTAPNLTAPDLPPPEMPDVLVRICADTRAETARRAAALPLEKIRARALANKERPRGFGLALKTANMQGRPGLIAEFKRRSPSGGDIRPGATPAEVTTAYAEAGAACLSILTDLPYFGGSLEDLAEARAAVPLPILRKDFILDIWQVYESRAHGADAILLIMAALSDAQARELEEAARSLDLDVLVEVHDRAELDRALGLQTKLLGINNRNLRTLRTTLATTEELAPHVPPDRILVTESGICSHADVVRLAATGSHCLLVGEHLLRQPDVAAATRALLGQPG